MLGLDPKSLLYSNPESLEEAFADIESTIESIREHDSDTPIVIGIDSLAVLGTRKELSTENFEHSPADGAIRAQVTGMCFRRINPVLRKHKVALVVINQIRSKIGVMYGSPDTNAAGGKSLEYYLGVDLKTFRRENLRMIMIIQRVFVGRLSVPKISIQFHIKNVSLSLYLTLV